MHVRSRAHRTRGVGVFLTRSTQGVPKLVRQFITITSGLPERTVLFSIVHATVPFISEVVWMMDGFYLCVIVYLDLILCRCASIGFFVYVSEDLRGVCVLCVSKCTG